MHIKRGIRGRARPYVLCLYTMIHIYLLRYTNIHPRTLSQAYKYTRVCTHTKPFYPVVAAVLQIPDINTTQIQGIALFCV